MTQNIDIGKEKLYISSNWDARRASLTLLFPRVKNTTKRCPLSLHRTNPVLIHIKNLHSLNQKKNYLCVVCDHVHSWFLAKHGELNINWLYYQTYSKTCVHKKKKKSAASRFSPLGVTNRFFFAAYAMLNHILNAPYGYLCSLNSLPFLDLNLHFLALPQPLLWATSIHCINLTPSSRPVRMILNIVTIWWIG